MNEKEHRAQIPFPQRSQWPNIESANNNSDLMSDRKRNAKKPGQQKLRRKIEDRNGMKDLKALNQNGRIM